MVGKKFGDIGMDLEKMNLSLAGCGYLGIYHVGVGACLRKFLPQVFQNKLSGASVGALVAAAFLCDVPLESCTMGVINVVLQVRHGILGPITPDLDIMTLLYENMACILPKDAHLYCNGKLHISVTRYEDCKNVLLSQFESKEDLLQALMCSCFIPFYCGFEPPKFHGVAYFDGGYSNNCPRLDAQTITVSPFDGETDICPKDKEGDFRTIMINSTSIFVTIENCRRIYRVLFPGPPDMMKELCQKGYKDALLFLRNHGFLQCPDCKPTVKENQVKVKSDHKNCKPLEYPIPIEMCNEIDAAVQRLQQSLGHRLLKNPIVKMLYYANIPSIFTAKISYSFFSAIARKLQSKTFSGLEKSSFQSKTPSKENFHLDFKNEGYTPEIIANFANGNELHPDSLKTQVINGNGKKMLHHSDNRILRVTVDTKSSINGHSTTTEVFRMTSTPPNNLSVTEDDTDYIIVENSAALTNMPKNKVREGNEPA